MGAACCCLQAEYENLSNPNGAVYRNCSRLQGFLQNFFHMYTLLLQSGDESAQSSSTQGTGPLTSNASMDNYVEMYRAPPRPMPFDAHPRYPDSRQEGIEGKREKLSTNMQEETEPLRNYGDENSESVGNKWNESACEKGSKYTISKIELQLSSAKTSTAYPFPYTDLLYEECPTCLEEYTIDNPKIVTKCSHHFHLGCIYEWMERSDKCPVCGKVMVFDEAT